MQFLGGLVAAAAGADAVGTLGLLAGGVGADGRPRDDDAGVDDERSAARIDRGITFLPKPFDLDRLLSVIARLLGRRNGDALPAS